MAQADATSATATEPAPSVVASLSSVPIATPLAPAPPASATRLALAAEKRIVTRTIVYISGPITQGNRSLNFANAAWAMQELIEAGYAPICPHLSMLHPADDQISYEKWLEVDFAWVEASQAVLRLPGFSPGADREVAHARSLNIPIYSSIPQLKEYCRATR